MARSDLKVASVQFENASGDKQQNLEIISRLSQQAAEKGCKVVAFHECSITGYTFASRLSREELHSIAEPVPDGPSIQRLVQIAKQTDMKILAGLFERDGDALYNTYVCVDGDGLIARYRKLHPFISQYLSAGNEYVVFEINGWKCGILICYDNNVIENVRATALLGAEIIFMPHVTMCTPSTRPGAGFVDPQLWHRRAEDPTSLKAEFHGLKGRAWLMKWLPARAYDNAVYCVFSNPIGMDDDQLKNGCSMILDPFGDILDECTELGEDMAVALCTKERLTEAGGSRYRLARRPELYGNIISQAHTGQQKVSWLAGARKKV
ncbi:carbon-nitrogen hydrolase [Aspergillus bertholletiae]|uniref:Carbon-nitrogen hydrolase n=1 Tax=Aspergillus bertholletiae TaxID=1226010 RepID=A0A5N7BA64_9EURO|nr:carbon-nitrogen hydrolase [Aspergillus bertholletiae]